MAEVGKGTGSVISEAEKAARDAGECRSCGALIYWVTMPSGKKMPVNRGRESRVVFQEGEWRVLGSYVSHFATCKQADQWRKS